MWLDLDQGMLSTSRLIVLRILEAAAMIKDIVVNLSVEGSRQATDFAVSVASAFGAHLAGVAFQYEPIVPATDMGGIPVDLIEIQRADNEKRAGDARAAFEEAARRAGLSFESRVVEASVAGASDGFGRIARRFDLSVVGQAEPEKSTFDELIIEGALFESGRPVLVVPYIQRAGLSLNHAMVCWDGSRNAARAVADAMPFLIKANKVDVVTIVGEKGKSDELPGADIAEHLARYGLKVELRRESLGDIDVANNILSLASDLSTDFLVMGGYGHSRLREFILGGATRGILSAMTVPTLMSH
jgi:nucleotide-binding universal stress UspA family protein